MNSLILALAMLGQTPPDPTPPPAELEVSHAVAIYQTSSGTKYKLTHTATIDISKQSIVISDVHAELIAPTPPGPVPPVPVPVPPTPGPVPVPPAPVVYCCPVQYGGHHCGLLRGVGRIVFFPFRLIGAIFCG